MQKKIISVLFAILIIVAIAPVSAFAEDDILDYLEYEIVDGEVTITGCDKSISGDVVIPDTIEGYPVTCILQIVFLECDNITSITIPDSVTAMFEGVFSGCDNLRTVNLGKGLSRIEQFSFYDCKSLESIVIPDSVTEIGLSAFDKCVRLETVKIGKGLAFIDDNVFFSCASLKKFIVDEENSNFSSDEHGVLFNKDKTVLISYPRGNASENYIVPEGVELVEYYAFDNCSFLKSVELPASTTRLYSAFEGTPLEKITFNNKNCIIDFDENSIPSTAVIYGYSGSIAESYAKVYARQFVAIDDDLLSSFVRFFESFAYLFNKIIVWFKSIFGMA